MRISITIILIITSLSIFSCSTVNLATRKGMDVQLDSLNYPKLKGNYSNLPINSIPRQSTLFNYFNSDHVNRENEFHVEVIPINANMINLCLKRDEALVSTIVLKGNYENGYFRVDREYETSFLAGPLIWILGEQLSYIGLTTDNNLIILNSGGSGMFFLIVLPILRTKGRNIESRYSRIN